MATFDASSERKLNYELEQLARLEEAIHKNEQIGTRMVTILDSVDRRLLRFNETISPLSNTTSRLTIRQKNLLDAGKEFDAVLEYYHVAEEADLSLKDNLDCNWRDAFTVLERVYQAVKFFERNSPDSQEISRLRKVLSVGLERLEREFRTIVTRLSQPIPYGTLLDLAERDEETPQNPNLEQELKQIPESTSRDLQALLHWLFQHDEKHASRLVFEYAELRGSMLLKSLQGIRSSKSLNSSGLSLGSGASRNDEGTPRKMVRRLSAMASLGGTLRRKGSAKFLQPGHKRQASISETEAHAVEVDAERFLPKYQALLRLSHTENQLMRQMLPSALHPKAFSLLIRPALEHLNTEADTLTTAVGRSKQRAAHSPLFAIFPVMQWVQRCHPEFRDELTTCEKSILEVFDTMLVHFQQTVDRGLMDHLDAVRNDSTAASNMPSDGTVHELTSNTVSYLETLAEFAESVGQVLFCAGSLREQSAEKCYANYVTLVLTHLGLNVKQKAEAYSDMGLRAVFLLNNYNYLLKTLSSLGILNAIGSKFPNAEADYQKLIVDQKKEYSISWTRAVQHLVFRGSTPGAKLGLRDRKELKERFANFNKEFDDIIRLQSAFSVPDEELKATLRRENREYICDLYKTFLQKVGDIDFTQNRDKYIKYRPEQIGTQMERLFESAG